MSDELREMFRDLVRSMVGAVVTIVGEVVRLPVTIWEGLQEARDGRNPQ